uniref:Uncharacterized protein n=1 Tax=Anguilla anguilla TaxID=7936 RepID=A0A0E9WZ52_ANGAN
MHQMLHLNLAWTSSSFMEDCMYSTDLNNCNTLPWAPTLCTVREVSCLCPQTSKYGVECLT